jgi:cyclic pyranopterin phosphate synthase
MQTSNPPQRSRFDLLASAILSLCRLGVEKVRFTGGEPTLYRRLPELVASVKRHNERVHTALTTNGILMSTLAARLADAGLDSVNISLDTLKPERFKLITSVDRLQDVIGGIEAAIRHTPRVKLNCVMMKGINDDEPAALVRFADTLGIDIRFIELMPSCLTGSNRSLYISAEEVRHRLSIKLIPLARERGKAARYYRSPELRIRVGFIAPVSEPFCTGCDRLRLTSDGHLYGCLFSAEGIDLYQLLDSGEENMAEAIVNLLKFKRHTGGAAQLSSATTWPSFSMVGG